MSEDRLGRHCAGSRAPGSSPARAYSWVRTWPPGTVARKRAWTLVGQSSQSCSPSASLLKPPQPLPGFADNGERGGAGESPRRPPKGQSWVPAPPPWRMTADGTLRGSCPGPGEARRPRGSSCPALQGPSSTVRPGGAPTERAVSLRTLVCPWCLLCSSGPTGLDSASLTADCAGTREGA